MSTEHYSECNLLFKFARRHGWGNPISKDGLVDLALESSEQGEGREVVDKLAEEPYVINQPGKGYKLKNDPDSQAQAAFRLKQNCGYSELRIEATFSRFEQAGGFDEYDDSVLDDLDDW